MNDQESTARTDLADLVRTRRAELGLSYESLGKLCVDPATGARAGGSWLHRLETGQPVIPPKQPKLHAIAAGLDLDPEVVQAAAAAQFHGVPDSAYLYPRPGVRLLVDAASSLTDDDVQLLIGMAKMLENQARERERDPGGDRPDGT